MLTQPGDHAFVNNLGTGHFPSGGLSPDPSVDLPGLECRSHSTMTMTETWICLCCAQAGQFQ